MKIEYTECDRCKEVLRPNQEYALVQYKRKGELGIIKKSESICMKCFDKRLNKNG